MALVRRDVRLTAKQRKALDILSKKLKRSRSSIVREGLSKVIDEFNRTGRVRIPKDRAGA